MTTIAVGPQQVGIFRALVIARGLDLFACTGMRPNRAFTPSKMMKVAAEITGKKFRARDYHGAAIALREFCESQRSAFAEVQQ